MITFSVTDDYLLKNTTVYCARATNKTNKTNKTKRGREKIFKKVSCGQALITKNRYQHIDHNRQITDV
jgi:hypothetical protein